MANRVRTVATKARAAVHGPTAEVADPAGARKGKDRGISSGMMAGRTIAVDAVSEVNRGARAGGDCIRVPGVADEAVRMGSGSVRRPTRLSIIRAQPT